MQKGSSYVNQGSATQLNSTKAYCGKVHESIFTWPLSGHALHVYILKFDLDIKRPTKINFIFHQKNEKNHTKKVIYNDLQHNYWIIIVSHSNNLHLFMLDPYTSLPLWIISQDFFQNCVVEISANRSLGSSYDHLSGFYLHNSLTHLNNTHEH